MDAEEKAPDKSLVKALVSDLDRAAKELDETARATGVEPVSEPVKSKGPVAEPRPSPHVAPETIRVEKAKLNSVLLQAEGLVRVKQSLQERASELREMDASLKAIEKQWAVTRNDARVIGRFLEKGRIPAEAPGMSPSAAKLIEFLESGRDLLKALHGRLSFLDRKMENDRRSVGTMVDALLEETKRISMTPFSTLFDILPRTVRDLLAAQGKEAVLTVSGGDVEVDRRILEEMKDPLIHLIRNCVDHGVEKSGDRTLRGRPPDGRISVSVSHSDSGKVELVVADDGPGVDLSRVRASAIRLGILSPEDAEKLDAGSFCGLIFRSGVSTSPLVTDISGRGLGLAIVQEKVEKLGGAVSCESSPDTGTVFRMLLPLTLATVKGILVRLEEEFFIIPAAHVRRVLRVPADEIKTVEGRETVSFEGCLVPLVRLSELLELPPRGKSEGGHEPLCVAIVESDEKVIAVKVDEVLHEQEFLMKGLGRQLKRVRNISGATVLGGGRVAPILNVPDLMKSAVKGGEAVSAVTARVIEPQAKRSVLVAEDSVTARTLLKNILETAGYDVKTAIDGVEAYSLLKAETFDLVVSDLDMPRMNGFELTTKIRSDKKLADLPVVLVTALDSREDRERGIDVGANAYIVSNT